MTKKKLPEIAPCPDGHKRGQVTKSNITGLFSVWCCGCCWIGPGERAPRAAILAWNRRSNAEAERLRSVAKGWEDRSVAQEKSIDKLIKERDEAELRGALKAAQWAGDFLSTTTGMDLRAAIKRGEVLPVKRKGCRKS